MFSLVDLTMFLSVSFIIILTVIGTLLFTEQLDDGHVEEILDKSSAF